MSEAIELLRNCAEINFKEEHAEDKLLHSYKIIHGCIERDISINYINDELVNIISQLSPIETTFQQMAIINWDDFRIVEKFKEKKPKIYENYLNFLKKELGLIKEEEETTSIYKKRENFNIREKNQEVANRFNVKIIKDFQKEPGKIDITNFMIYFNRRYDFFYKLLSNRINIERVVKIKSLKENFPLNEEVDLIGLLNNVRETKKGYIIEIEDKTDRMNCFINKENTELVNLIQDLCYDEGIAVKGKKGDNIVWTEEITVATPPQKQIKKRKEEEGYVLCLSDFHFSSKLFTDEAFQRLVDFLNGETNNEKLNKIAAKVKHIIVAGDVIEGIGIYPDQGKDVRVLSTELQYHEAARWLSQIPDDKCIIIIPGNHDTCRLSEPQPRIPYDKAYALYHLPNTLMLSNPSIINLFSDDESAGFDFYLYHGGSLFYYGREIQSLRDKGGVKKPNEVVKFLLEKRHIAPSHGSTLYYPDMEEDPLVINKLPDFFVLGHTHKLDVSMYKNTYILSCGCWNEMSDYQEKQGMYPDPGKAILFDLKEMKPHVLNFYK